jgi:hypothetical protein
MNEQHLSDDRLIEICVSGPPRSVETAHLAACTACERRRLSIVQILDELDAAATVEADAAFPPERLERQHARIVQRIDQDGRPARLLPFPASQPTMTLRSRRHVRVAAAAAAAAFVIGLMAGHLVHDLPLPENGAPTGIVPNESSSPPLQVVPTTFSEDEFLGQIELAAARNGPAALRPLDAMTPRAWEVR